MRTRAASRVLGFVAFALAACSDGTRSDDTPLTAWAVAPALRVQGNRLVDVASGRAVLLRGVSRPGTESACITGTGIHAGPADSLAVEAMRAWGINTVRVPLNESCWLGVDGVATAHGGAAYQQAIADWVALLTRRGMVTVLALDWTGPGTTADVAQRPMPSRARTPQLWTQVATRFAGNRAVLLELHAASWPDGNRTTPEAWRCWRDGGTCANVGYETVGMQALVTAIRNAGATNVLLVGGVQYGGSLTSWLAHRPFDPRGNLAAAWRIFDNFLCNRRSCWDAYADVVADSVPLVLTEFGDNTGDPALPSALLDFMDERRGHWVAAGWRASGAPGDLLANWDGTPSTYGATIRERATRLP